VEAEMWRHGDLRKCGLAKKEFSTKHVATVHQKVSDGKWDVIRNLV
jgi:hypothetical protein